MTIFLALILSYCLFYAPYGINETDGGFLTGLAWQVLSGKMLYGDIIYVRPPLPVWLRAAELNFLPDQWAILGERWIFYCKVALYSWLGAAVLTSGTRRWMLAAFGFVVSAHCYPPMAWHTVDGILFSVAGIWCWTNRTDRRGPAFYQKASLFRSAGALLAGIFIFAAMLCKQSFYPMAPVFVGLALFSPTLRKVIFTWRAGWGIGAFIFCIVLFFSYLYSNDHLENYFLLTGGAASGSQALQHGVLDYFRIKPALALGSVALLAPVAWFVRKEKHPKVAAWLWACWLSALTASFAYEVWSRQTFTVPFAQARLLFWAGIAFALLSTQSPIPNPQSTIRNPQSSIPNPSFLALCAVSWCASVSWGYNLPVLFSTPWVFAIIEISRRLWQRADYRLHLPWMNIAALAGLLLVFRMGYEFVYRDGRRSEMDAHLGDVFPQLRGIYSTAEKFRLYLDLKDLAGRYPAFKTMPAFTQANFLTRTRPPLPLDWVVNRETNGDNAPVEKNIKEKRPLLFVEKSWADKIPTDPELSLTSEFLSSGTILDESAHFWVVLPR